MLPCCMLYLIDHMLYNIITTAHNIALRYVFLIHIESTDSDNQIPFLLRVLGLLGLLLGLLACSAVCLLSEGAAPLCDELRAS